MATALRVNAANKEKVEKIKNHISSEAEHLISSRFPQKIEELEKLLASDILKLTDLSRVRGELDIPIPDPPKKDEENGDRSSDGEDGKEKKKEKPPKCGLLKANSQIVNLAQLVKPQLNELKEACIMLTTWIQHMVPKIEDGNDFGVAIQEKILERTGAVKTKVEGFQTSITKYFTERGDAVAKASKDTHVMDYRRLVHEKDEAAYMDLKTMLMDIRGFYIELLDIIVKNKEKIMKPKGEEKALSMY